MMLKKLSRDLKSVMANSELRRSVMRCRRASEGVRTMSLRLSSK